MFRCLYANSCSLIDNGRYISPLLWGRSGHLQTIIHSTLGRNKTPKDKGDSRHSIMLSDGSTVTFDMFLPNYGQHSNKQQDQGTISHNKDIKFNEVRRNFMHYLITHVRMVLVRLVLYCPLHVLSV